MTLGPETGSIHCPGPVSPLPPLASVSAQMLGPTPLTGTGLSTTERVRGTHYLGCFFLFGI